MMSKVTNILMLSSILFLMSCQNDVEDVNSSNENSTFELGEIKAVSFETYASNEKWPELKDRAVVDLKVCILDKHYLENVVGEDFQINSDLKSSGTPSNGQGCIKWQEEFEFDISADETFYKIAGDISGKSNHKGLKNFKIAVNPWSKKVVDLDPSNGGSVQKLKSILGDISIRSLKSQLEIKKYNLNINSVSFNQGEQTTLSLELSTIPQIKRINIDGENTDLKLSGGKFNIEFVLFQREKGSSNRIVLGSTNSIDHINQEGLLVSNIELNITDQFDHQGILEMAVNIEPVDSPLNIGRDQGYIVFESIETASHGTLIDLPKKLSLLKEIAIDYKSLRVRKKLYKKPVHGFILNEISGKFSNEQKGNLIPGKSDRHVQLEIEIELVDSLAYEGINSEFEVELIDMYNNTTVGDIIKKPTSQKKGSGKLTITPIIDFGEQYNYEYRDYKLVVRGTKGRYKNLIQERKIFINPYVERSEILIDSKDSPNKPKGGENNKPELYISEYQFDFDTNDLDSYKVNKSLELVSERSIKVKFNPKLKVDNNYDGVNAGYPSVMSGLFNVSLMVLTPKRPLLQKYDQDINLDDFYLLTGDEKKDVMSINGKVSATFDLPHLFDERSLLSFKNIAVLRIESADPDSTYRPGYILSTLNVFDTKGEVEPLLDMRVRDAKAIRLIQSNSKLISFYKKEIKSMKDKLEKDSLISDRFEMFKEDLLENEMDETVPVIDHERYKIVAKKVKFEVFGSQKDFRGQKSLRISSDSIEDMILDFNTTSVETLKELCKVFYDPKQKTITRISSPKSDYSRIEEKIGLEYERCRKSPVEHIGFKELRFINRVVSQPAELKERYNEHMVTESHTTMLRSEAYFVSKGVMHSEIKGTRKSNYIGFGLHSTGDLTLKALKAPLALFTAIGPEIGSRTDYYSMTQDTKLLNNQRRIINGNSQEFWSESVNVTFEADLKKCVVIQPRFVKGDVPVKQSYHGMGSGTSIVDWFKEEDSRPLVTSNKRVIVCLDYNRVEQINDEWYFVRILPATNTSVGDYSMPANQVVTTLRGHRAFEEFRSKDLDNDKKILIQKGTKEEVVKRYNNFIKDQGKAIRYKTRLGQGYPGLIE